MARSLITAVVETVPEFRMHGQQDAEEALTYALNNLHDDLFVPVPKELHPAYGKLQKLEKERIRLEHDAKLKSGRKDAGDEATRKKKEEEARIAQAYEPYKRSVVSDTFQSLLAQRVTCSKCSATSLTVQECFNVPLELPSKAQTKTLNGTNGEGRPYANSKATVSALKSIPSSVSLEPGSPKPATKADPAGDGSSGSGFLSSTWSSLRSALSFTGHTLELDQCLKSFFALETLKGDEQYYCEHCKTKEDATKVLELVHLPEVVCFQLKRFNKNRGTLGLGSAKNSTTVRYPVEGLDLSPYCGNVCSENGDCALYDLISVVRHSGGANSGHYIATCKSVSHNKWFEYDDEFVTSVSNVDQLQSPDAYLLFYAKRPAQSDSEKRERALKALRSPASDTSRSFISRYWALKFETMTQPGPVDNCSFACEHGAVAIPALQDVKDRVISIPTSALNDLEQLYQGPVPPLRIKQLEACEICKEAYEAMEARRSAELEECSELFKKVTKVYYMVPRAWFLKWLAFVHNDCGPLGRGPWTGTPPPSKIDVASLLDKDDKSVRPNLKLDSNYLAVNKFVFKFWEKTYGVTAPPLARVGRDIYSAIVEDTDDVEETIQESSVTSKD